MDTAAEIDNSERTCSDVLGRFKAAFSFPQAQQIFTILHQKSAVVTKVHKSRHQELALHVQSRTTQCPQKNTILM